MVFVGTKRIVGAIGPGLEAVSTPRDRMRVCAVDKQSGATDVDGVRTAARGGFYQKERTMESVRSTCLVLF